MRARPRCIPLAFLHPSRRPTQRRVNRTAQQRVDYPRLDLELLLGSEMLVHAAFWAGRCLTFDFPRSDVGVRYRLHHEPCQGTAYRKWGSGLSMRGGRWRNGQA
jgi:hypothetical protein